MSRVPEPANYRLNFGGLGSRQRIPRQLVSQAGRCSYNIRFAALSYYWN